MHLRLQMCKLIKLNLQKLQLKLYYHCSDLNSMMALLKRAVHCVQSNAESIMQNVISEVFRALNHIGLGRTISALNHKGACGFAHYTVELFWTRNQKS